MRLGGPRLLQPRDHSSVDGRRKSVPFTMRHELRRVHSSFPEEKNTLEGKVVFAAVWMKVALASWAMKYGRDATRQFRRMPQSISRWAATWGRKAIWPFRRIVQSISRRAASLDRRFDLLFASSSSKAARELIRPFRRVSRLLSKLTAQ